MYVQICYICMHVRMCTYILQPICLSTMYPICSISSIVQLICSLCVCVCAQNTNRAREKHDTNAQANHLCDLHVIVRSLSQLDDFVYDGSGNERAQVVFVCFCANRHRARPGRRHLRLSLSPFPAVYAARQGAWRRVRRWRRRACLEENCKNACVLGAEWNRLVGWRGAARLLAVPTLAGRIACKHAE